MYISCVNVTGGLETLEIYVQGCLSLLGCRVPLVIRLFDDNYLILIINIIYPLMFYLYCYSLSSLRLDITFA